MTAQWARNSRQWSRIGPPLRPTEEMAELYRDAVEAEGKRILLFGVTPELTGLGRELVAVDRSIDMISRVWPGNDPHRRVVLARWQALPLADESADAAVGDGIFNVNPFPQDAAQSLAELERALRPGGRVAFRGFCSPEEPDSLSEVRRAAFEGEIGSFHALRWRVAMAVVAAQGDPNVAVIRILEAFNETFPDRDALSRDTGWALETIATIDAYAGMQEVYSFPTEALIKDFLAERFVDVRSLDSGRYPLSERCPLIVFRKSGG